MILTEDPTNYTERTFISQNLTIPTNFTAIVIDHVELIITTDAPEQIEQEVKLYEG